MRAKGPAGYTGPVDYVHTVHNVTCFDKCAIYEWIRISQQESVERTI